MGAVITEGRLIAVVSIAVILTMIVVIFVPWTPVVVTPYNGCLWTDPPPDWCLKNPIPTCGILGCPPPPCGDDCPYFVDNKSLVDIWSLDQTAILENAMQFDRDYRNLYELVNGSMELP